ncbi:MAG: ABC transporter ATP-binding protein, partial [Victivallaceae bacterium]|nr:ABC transporter ATP-binding protein [Victivallaceae bacterium]
AVDRALVKVGLYDKRDRFANTLSGGEFQRLELAAALALEGDFLLLDEPTSAQDPVFSQLVAEILREESAVRGVLTISHDLALAARFADEAWLLGGGGLFDRGAPSEVLVPEKLGALYRCRAEVVPGRDFRFSRRG